MYFLCYCGSDNSVFPDVISWDFMNHIDLFKYQGQKMCGIFQTTIVNDIHEIHHLMKHSMNDSCEWQCLQISTGAILRYIVILRYSCAIMIEVTVSIWYEVALQLLHENNGFPTDNRKTSHHCLTDTKPWLSSTHPFRQPSAIHQQTFYKELLTPCLLKWKDSLIVKPCCIPIYINNTSPDSFVQYYIKNYEKKFNNHFSRIFWWSVSVLVPTDIRYCLGLKATIITKIKINIW